MPALIENESSLTKKPQRDSAAASPIANDRDVPRLAEQNGFVSSVQNTVADGIENPGSIAEDAYTFCSGSGPVSNDRKVGCFPVVGGRGIGHHMPRIRGEFHLALIAVRDAKRKVGPDLRYEGSHGRRLIVEETAG